MLIQENISVNKRANMENKQLKLYSEGLSLFSFSTFTFGFHGFHLKKLKIIQYDFGTGEQKKIKW